MILSLAENRQNGPGDLISGKNKFITYYENHFEFRKIILIQTFSNWLNYYIQQSLTFKLPFPFYFPTFSKYFYSVGAVKTNVYSLRLINRGKFSLLKAFKQFNFSAKFVVYLSFVTAWLLINFHLGKIQM